MALRSRKSRSRVAPKTRRPARQATSPAATARSSSALVVEESSLGFIKANLERKITFVNPAAHRMLGVDVGMRLSDFLVDDESRKTLDSQLSDRLKGLIGNYKLNARRRTDGVVIPVEVTGLPDVDQQGEICGSLGIFRSLERQHLVNDVHGVNRDSDNVDGLLDKVAERLQKAVPFELMIVSRYSKDLGHAHSFYLWPRPETFARGRRWIQVTKEQLAWIQRPDTQRIGDIPAEMEKEIWAPLREEPFVKSLLDSGFLSSLARPVYRAKRLIGVFSFLSRKRNAFSPEHKELIEELPLDGTMANAVDYGESQRLKMSLEIVRALNGCTSIKQAGEQLVRHLVEMYGWSHVGVFRVDRPAGKADKEKGGIVLVTQHSPDPSMRLETSYSQKLDEGVLGQVVREARPVYMETVKDNPGYLRPPGWPVQDGSELCVPISFPGERMPRWLINVEEKEPGAFSEEERNELGEIAGEAAAVMQRIKEAYFLTQSFEHASDPIFVTDASFCICKANKAAALLLEKKQAVEVSGSFSRLSPGSDIEARVKNGEPEIDLTVTVKRTRGEPKLVPVHVSYERLPEGLPGYVFVVKDMSEIRRGVELELLEKVAYEVAAEASTPLSLAITTIEGLVANGQHAEALKRVQRQLGRVKRAYNKLAMFNQDARPTPKQFIPIDLQSELGAILANLPKEQASLVHTQNAKAMPGIKGDPFQISFTLETLLSLLIRAAPQREGAQVEFGQRDGEVEVRLSGYLPGGSLDSTFNGQTSAIQAELQIARPLLDSFVHNHAGTLEEAPLAKGRHQFVLRFPALATP